MENIMMVQACTEDIRNILTVMRRQEEDTAYCVCDYFEDERKHGQDTVVNFRDRYNNSSPHYYNECYGLDAKCQRKIMIQWCYQLAATCGFHRETVSIAVSHFDRFLSSSPVGDMPFKSADIFQLTLFTCLYTAVKVNGNEAMDPDLISMISRGVFNADHVASTEQTILTSLEWRLNPPTVTSFVHHLWKLICHLVPSTQHRDAILSFATFQAELAIMEYEFVSLKPSTVALSCLMNAIEQTNNLAAYESKASRHEITLLIWDAVSLDCKSSMVRNTQRRLQILVMGSPTFTSVARSNVASTYQRSASPTCTTTMFSPPPFIPTSWREEEDSANSYITTADQFNVGMTNIALNNRPIPKSIRVYPSQEVYNNMY